MLYEEYAKKIAKKKNRWKFFYRFRAPLIIFTTMAVMVTASLVGGRGVVFDKKVVSESYVYGQTYEYSAYSFLSNASYEFAPLDSDEWSEKSPTFIGQYKMRSKGKNNFNNYYYGKEHTFEIVPKKVDVIINQDNLTYGETPTISIDLVDGDRLNTDYTFTIDSDLTLDKWTYVPNESSISIKNALEEDVTSCYEFNVIKKDINILKKAISIKSSSNEKTYDGKELKEDGFKVVSGSLVPGDEIELLSTSSITSVGNINNEQSYAIKNKDGLDMTSHYAIEHVNGSLTINKRPITFTIGSFDHTYDGEKHLFSLNDITYAQEEVAKNQKAIFSYTTEEGFLKVGEYTNAFKAKIVEGDVDVSSNYDINYVFGSTVINKRLIRILSASDEITYDGKEHNDNSYTIKEGSLAEKDTVDIVTNSFTDSGTYVNEAEVKIIDKVTNEDFTSCYDFGVEYGEYIINKAKITVEIDTLDIVYDGLPHKNTCHISEGALVNNDKLEIVNNEEKVDAGCYDKDEFEVKIKTKDGVDNTKNYEITYTNTRNALNIQKRPITINTNSKEKKYDAKSIVSTLPEDNIPYVITSGSLASNERIDFKYLNDLTNAGELAISSEIKILHIEEGSAEKNVTSNYDITVNNGNFKVNQRNITIKTLDFTHVYDRITTIPGDTKTYEVTSDGDGLIEGHKVTKLNVECDEVNVGSYSYDVKEESLKIEDTSHNDVTANYNVTYINEGKVTITKRPVSLSMTGDHRVYDGTPFTSNKYTASNLLSGDTFTFINLPSVTHVMEGKIENVPESWQIFTSDGEEVTGNYEVTIAKKGNIYIDPRPISITSPTFEKVYDGVPLSKDNDIRVTFGTLAVGDTLVTDSLLSKDNTYKHVTDIENTFTYHIVNPNGMDVTEDYLVTEIIGKIKITPRPLTLKSDDFDKEFDGIPLEKGGAVDIASGTSLAQGDTLTITSLDSLDITYVHAAIYTNFFTFTLINADNEDVAFDYDIACEYGQINIDPCPITLNVFETYIPYDGLDHSFSYTESEVSASSGTIYISGGALPEGFSLGATISTAGGEMINVGVYSYDWSYSFSTTLECGALESDFIVTLVGKQEISQRIIGIQTISGIKVYDGLPYGSDMNMEDLAWISSGSLADGDSIAIILVPMIEVGTYTSEVASLVITNGSGEEVTGNYYVFYIVGEVIIDEN